MSPRLTRFTAGRVTLVLRWAQQTIRDVRGSLDERRNPGQYVQGWNAACDALQEAFSNPTAISETLVEAPREDLIGWGDKREKSE